MRTVSAYLWLLNCTQQLGMDGERVCVREHSVWCGKQPTAQYLGVDKETTQYMDRTCASLYDKPETKNVFRLTWRVGAGSTATPGMDLMF